MVQTPKVLVNSFRLDFYSGLNRNDQLIGSFNSGLFSPDHLLSWDVSALNLLGVQSFTLVMLERDAITSPSVPGQWYEMGHLSLDASPVPIPAAAWLLGSALDWIVWNKAQEILKKLKLMSEEIFLQSK